MSLYFDVGLFFRNSKTKLGLSISLRGILYPLALRVGSHANTWIKHETLAKELGIHRQNLVPQLQKLVDSKIIEMKVSKKDKRLRLYSFSDKIKNYALKNDAGRKKVHASFGDTFEYDELEESELDMSAKPDRCPNHMSGKPDRHVSGKPDRCSRNKIAVSPATKGLAESVQIPKGKEQRDNKKERDKSLSANAQNFEDLHKSTVPKTRIVECASSDAQTPFDLFWSVYPIRKNKERAAQIWKRKKLDAKEDLIFFDIQNRLAKDAQWQDKKYIPHPSTYLNGELWNDDITPKKEDPIERAERVAREYKPIYSNFDTQEDTPNNSHEMDALPCLW